MTGLHTLIQNHTNYLPTAQVSLSLSCRQNNNQRSTELCFLSNMCRVYIHCLFLRLLFGLAFVLSCHAAQGMQTTTIQKKYYSYFATSDNLSDVSPPTLLESVFMLFAKSQHCVSVFLCLAKMKKHPSNMQGQLNNVSHTPCVVSFFCLCSSAVFIGNKRHVGSPHEGSVPVLIYHLKRISCYKPIDA